MSRHRSYCFTLNNPDEKDLDNLINLEFKYMILGFETGKKGTPHIQGYIQYHNPASFTKARLDLIGSHVEVAKGTPKQNIDYCSKDGDWYEYGVRPTEGGKVTYEQVAEAFNNPRENMTIIRQYGKAYEYVRQLDITDSIVSTRYYTMLPVMDAISEVLEYFGRETNLIIVTSVAELAAYDDEDFIDKTVVILYPLLDHLIPLYPRGVPIKYKYGFNYHTCKPKNLVIVTDKYTLGRLTGYKKI